MSWLARLFRPARYGLGDVVRDGAGRLVLPCLLRPGWVRIRLGLAADLPGCLRISDGAGVLLDTPPVTDASGEFYLRLERPARCLRFEPIDGRADLELSRLAVEELSTGRVLLRSVAGRFALLARYGSGWRAALRGAGLLLRGRFGAFLSKLHNGLSGPAFVAPADYDADRAYEEWQRRRPPFGPAPADGPLLSVVLAVLEEGPRWRASVESMLRQTYSRWELCVAIGPGVETHDRADARVRFLRTAHGDRVGLLNAAVSAASGDYVAFLGAGDELAPHALQRVAEHVAADGDLDLLYSDEDRLTASGRRDPFFKPGWSPEYLLGRDYALRLGVLRTSLVRDMGGLRPDLGEAAEYDLVLRAAARTSRVGHVPDVLYHARSAPRPGPEDVRRALIDHLAETGRAGVVEPAGPSGEPRVRFRVLGTPLVSIVIPSAFACRRGASGEWPVLLDCVRGIRERTTWGRYEVVVVATRDVPEAVRPTLEAAGVKVVSRPGPFNFAATINAGASHARGDHLLLLNDDVEVLTPDWLERLLEYSQQPDIGAVGATLLFPNGRLQHVGIHVLDGRPTHACYGYPGDHPGPFGYHGVPRNYSAVTGACLMTRAEVFRAVGGLDPAFPLDFNDVDYCLRLLRRGWRVVSTPDARLLHHEAFTRRGGTAPDGDLFRDRWAAAFPRDPYYNPNCSTRVADYRVE